MKPLHLISAIAGLGALLIPITASAAKQAVSVTSELGHSVLMKNKKQKAYVRIRLQGEKLENLEERAPVNIAIVIDKSGSMGGEKIKRAKEAAIMALNRMADDDIVSIITYDTKVNIISPATRVGDSRDIKAKINQLRPGGSTALYAGTKHGIREIREFLSENFVNRVILISDGLANVGPSSPEALGELGREAAEEGISITTIGLGLGYNEDLMAKLAFTSDGNHAFVENASDLVNIFNNEFGDVLSVIAQDVEVEIIWEKGIKPIRSLGRQAKIEKNKVSYRLNQIYSAQKKEFILEVEAPDTLKADELKIADVKVRYLNMKNKTREKGENTIKAKLVESESEWQSSANKAVMTSVATQIATIENEKAVKLRDQGKVEEAKKVLQKNYATLKAQSKAYGSRELDDLSKSNKRDAENLEGRNWKKTRKMMRAIQHKSKTQQSY